MRHAIFAGKLVEKISKTIKRAGSTWPGHIALKADSKLVNKILLKNPEIKIVLVAGTNGKTTTTKALAHVLKATGVRVLTNSAGANLLSGITSTIVSAVSFSGKINHNVLIFEVDENSLPLILKEIENPDAIVLLNLFRDQLDRYGEVNTTAQRWEKAFEKLTTKTKVVANADDPLIAHVATAATKHTYFSVPSKFKTARSLSHAVDSTTCPKCTSPLDYLSISYSHLGNYFCPNCSYSNPKTTSFEIPTNLLGTYNQYNLNAAALVLKEIFGMKEKEILDKLSSIKPAFGRQEEIMVGNKRIMYLLSKNPTGFNESLKVAIQYKSNSILILLNDRVPDGRDISWIWDVDFETLQKAKMKIFVSGDRCFDMANRLLFAGVSYEVYEDLEQAYRASYNSLESDQKLTILPTYSAMLDVRKLISGRSIL